MSGEFILIIFQVAILIMSVVIHEVSHGLMALRLGDPTAKYAERLTLNPIKHFDLWGSFIVPFFMIVTFNFGFGWAKPVPYNPYNLRDQKNGPAWVAFAGPASNIVTAIIFALGARFITLSQGDKLDIMRNLFNFNELSVLLAGSFAAIFFWLFIMILAINVFLAVFNLIPIPPLDGSKLLFTIISISEEKQRIMEQFGLFLLLAVIFLLSTPIWNFMSFILSLFFKYLVGIG